MNTVDLIVAKRDGAALTDEAIRWFISEYTAGAIADHQAAALLMAIVFQGMSDGELATWTDAMIESGTRRDLANVGRPTVDKHSTGGVGDKVSLVLCPLVAACGGAVPQVSGRGLGHTGGTLDKLESIPGWSAHLDADAVIDQLREVGAVIVSASDDLAPADARLYALRDVTGTVASLPLIASSIMSKKIASGTEALVLDVKVGRAAVLPDLATARALAETMVELGSAEGVRTSALLTDMNTPLGRTAGNALEVREAVECLAGGGPADLRAITLALAHEMCRAVDLEADPEALLDSGAAMDRWRSMIVAQGGDPDAPLPHARHQHVIEAPTPGLVADLDALAIGRAAWRLGAGRADKDDPVSAGAGIELHVDIGDDVATGQAILTLHSDDPTRLDDAETVGLATRSVILGDEPVTRPLIIDRVEPGTNAAG